jgi:hypothetical protein
MPLSNIPLSVVLWLWLGPIVLRLGACVPPGCELIALISRAVSRRRGSQASTSVLLSELRCVRTMHTGRVTSPLVTSGGGFLIASGLILIGRRLVAV